MSLTTSWRTTFSLKKAVSLTLDTWFPGVWCEVWAHPPPPQAAETLPRWPSSWWTVTRQKPNWQVPSSKDSPSGFLLAQPLRYLFGPLCESSWDYSPPLAVLSPQDVVPLSHSNPRNTALMNWEPPSGLKTPAWMMSPPTMRFRTWIGGTEGSPR